MAAFSQTELRILSALAEGKSLKKLGETSNLSEETIDATVQDLKERLGADKVADLPERFRNVTGWSGKPSEYA